MVEEGSLMFQVENSEIDSEEEDELLRKQELQKLLSEELQDDLLDTSEEEEEGDGEDCDLTCDSREQSSVFDSRPLQVDYNKAQLTSHNLALINQQSHFILNEEEPRMQFGNENVQLFENHILPRTSPQLPIEIPSLTNEESNVFNGTSQEYSLLNEHDNQNSSSVQSTSISDNKGHFFSELSHLDRQHLEALYVAKNRQINELETEIKRIISEEERKCGILRHKVQLLEEGNMSLVHKREQYETDIETLRARIIEYEQQQERNNLIISEREELREKLSSSHTTINLLTTQLNEMSNTDVLQKIRQNYESVIERTNEEHKRNTQTLEHRIVALEGEIHETQSKNNRLSQEIESHKVSRCTVDRCDGVLEMGEEKKQLIAEVEDLTFQLNTLQEDMVISQGKVEQLEKAIHDVEESHQNILRERTKEEDRLKDSLEKLQDELSNQNVIAEKNLKTSLEHCRNACIKLHEDSTASLKQEFIVEKDKIESQYKTELSRLRQSMGKDKEKLRKEHEGMLQKQIDVAITSAHSLWKGDEQRRMQIQIQSLVKQMTKDHERKLADGLAKKETDWSGKYKKLADQANSLKQKSETEIMQLKQSLSEAKCDQKNEKLVTELKSIFKSLQTAMIELMSQMLTSFEEEKNKQLKETRQLALKEAETHYLACLHALVNNKHRTQ